MNDETQMKERLLSQIDYLVEHGEVPSVHQLSEQITGSKGTFKTFKCRKTHRIHVDWLTRLQERYGTVGFDVLYVIFGKEGKEDYERKVITKHKP